MALSVASPADSALDSAKSDRDHWGQPTRASNSYGRKQDQTICPKPRKRLPLTSRDFPSSLPVTQADMLYIPEKSLSPAAQMEIRGLATFANPEFYRAQAMHQSVFGKPRLIDLSELRDGYVAIPRGCKLSLSSCSEKPALLPTIQTNANPAIKL